MKFLFTNVCLRWGRWLKHYLLTKYKFRTVRVGSRSVCCSSHLGTYVTLYDNVTVDNSVIGDYTYISNDSVINNASIGKFCSIGPGVKIGCGRHPTKRFVSTSPIFYSINKQVQVTFADKMYYEESKMITIGNDVWIGANVFLCDGVSIGTGAIVAANSVVTGDVKAYSIVGGVPAKFICYRFSDEIIKKLLLDKWWDKNIDWIKKNFKVFHNIDSYLDLVEKK